MRRSGDDTIVEASDPQTRNSVTANQALQPVVNEVADKLKAGLASLAP